tara:strand:+ start:170 stop:289 length:120 start_codon:yes stop_codon:yes gene_type:complete
MTFSAYLNDNSLSEVVGGTKIITCRYMVLGKPIGKVIAY